MKKGENGGGVEGYISTACKKKKERTGRRKLRGELTEERFTIKFNGEGQRKG